MLQCLLKDLKFCPRYFCHRFDRGILQVYFVCDLQLRCKVYKTIVFSLTASSLNTKAMCLLTLAELSLKFKLMQKALTVLAFKSKIYFSDQLKSIPTLYTT